MLSSNRLLAVGLLALHALLAAPLDGRQEAGLARLEQTEEAMGASFSLVLYGADRPALQAAADAAFEEVHRLDRLLSNYRPASEWSAMNRDAASGPVKVPAELFALLSSCLDYSRRSGGAFDITVGPLMKVWGFYKGEGRLPAPGEIGAALSRVGYRHVRLDPVAKTVGFARDGVELDPGGIGKGYAVDRMVQVLEREGVRIALVSSAGSSIYGLGAPPGEPNGWPISIRDPRQRASDAATTHLKDLSLSTSGSDEKFFWTDGRTYSHIIDPRTGYPAKGISSVSVLSPRALDSEAWTKPFFINGRAWTEANKPRGVRVFMCEEAPPQTCSWLP